MSDKKGIQSITPYLWFADRLEEAVNFYVSVFPDSKVVNVSDLGGGVSTAVFELRGQEFMALQGGNQYSFTPAVSFFVKCQTQDEVDHYWDKLTDGGEEQPCGWLVDRYGVSWQVIPDALGECLGDPDPERAQRAMNAMFQMKKIDIAALKAAREG